MENHLIGMIIDKANYRAALKEIKSDLPSENKHLSTEFLLASDKMDSETPA